MVEIRWTYQSLEDIENIAEFIAKDSPKYAKIQVQLFFDRTEILKTYPKSGRIVPETNDKEIRELILGNYRIIYHINEIRRELLVAIVTKKDEEIYKF